MAGHSHREQGNGHAFHAAGRAAVARRPVDASKGIRVEAVVVTHPQRERVEELADRGGQRSALQRCGVGGQVLRHAYGVDDLRDRRTVGPQERPRPPRAGQQSYVLGEQPVVGADEAGPGHDERLVVAIAALAGVDHLQPVLGGLDQLVVPSRHGREESAEERVGVRRSLGTEAVSRVEEVELRVQQLPVVLADDRRIDAEEHHGSVSPVRVDEHQAIGRRQAREAVGALADLLRPLAGLEPVLGDVLVARHQHAASAVPEEDDLPDPGMVAQIGHPQLGIQESPVGAAVAGS